MGCSFVFRGNFVPRDVGIAVATIKTNRVIRFVDWCETKFKCAIGYNKPCYFEGKRGEKGGRGVYFLGNSTGVKRVFRGVVDGC